MKRIVTLLLLVLTIISCTSREYVFLLENGHKEELNNLPIEIILDGNIVFNGKTKISNITPSHQVFHKNTTYNVSLLEVKISDKIFRYDILYPKDKYIIISPFSSDNELQCAIKTSETKFSLE